MDRQRAALSLGLILLTTITRIPFASRFLYHLDSVHFALALEKYDLSIHQPHPPGYILYVMTGKFLHLLLGDSNAVFISLSILFSGLSIALIFLFAEEVWDRRTGILAAMFALSSPNLWFHGEVALSYPADCFFSILVAYLGWKVFREGPRLLWASAVALGLAGGFRQSTLVFLLPLWLYSIRNVRLSKIAFSLSILALVSMSWFSLMVWETGGLGAYLEAFRDLWVDQSGTYSVFQWGWASVSLFSKTLWRFSLYDVGACIFLLVIAAYSILRNRRLTLLDRDICMFLLLWIIPSVSFYLLIFIHPGNPGYALILLPPFSMLSARSFVYVADHFTENRKKELSAAFASLLILLNAGMFLLSKSPVSIHEIRDHDRNLSMILAAIKGHDPKKTLIISADSLFYNSRQVMYYLPAYPAYQLSMEKPGIAKRITVWGKRRRYSMGQGIPLPGGVDSFAAIVVDGTAGNLRSSDGLNVRELASGLFLVSGAPGYLTTIYPGFAPSPVP